MHIVVGLGNPSGQYQNSRHNAGRMAADFIAGKIKGVKVFTPDTFMNKTGPAVAKVLVGKSAKKLIIIYDDLDLPLGSLKISYNRSSGGHKGLESVIRALKTKEFIRIRIGIRKKKKVDVEKYILGNFTKSEMSLLRKVFKKVKEAIEAVVNEGMEKAMNQFN
ncbi:MAG: aminoacyl-tRNA hydrolase [Candidatus Zambryskibacteria bacterium]|nr:aminoacyl-tRNA hydrolase [Candidatus Zambryskibacteria bacterium]